jgi:hypothetical protein
MSHQHPSIGRIVHYVERGPDHLLPGEHRAALITEIIGDDHVNLCVFAPLGVVFHLGVPFDATGAEPQTWHWPEYVPPREEPKP